MRSFEAMGKNGYKMVTETRGTEKVLPDEKSEVVTADGTYSSSARNRTPPKDGGVSQR
jgi:hypothetical protein